MRGRLAKTAGDTALSLSEPARSAISEGAKAAGAVSIIGVTILGLTLQEWAALSALVWTLWLLGEKAVATIRRWRARRAGD